MTNPGFALLTNHAQVLLCLRDEPEARMRDVAARLSITERAVQRIVADLAAAGYLRREKQGRRNRYQVGREPLAVLDRLAGADDPSPRVSGGSPIARNDSFID